ncbi:MAG: hypothetical protein M3252_01655 [Actinomycetota bacterium]|nr:hypothetical protein [Actinomycetota bacterium]
MSQLGGIGKVRGDAKARLIKVEYDPAILSVEAIQDALESVGYESTVMT